LFVFFFLFLSFQTLPLHAMEDSVSCGKRASVGTLAAFLSTAVHGARPCRLVKVVWVICEKRRRKGIGDMIDLEHSKFELTASLGL
jgi:hypothetical protein